MGIPTPEVKWARLVFTSQCRSEDEWALVGAPHTCLQGQLKSLHVFTLHNSPVCDQLNSQVRSYRYTLVLLCYMLYIYQYLL